MSARPRPDRLWQGQAYRSLVNHKPISTLEYHWLEEVSILPIEQIGCNCCPHFTTRTSANSTRTIIRRIRQLRTGSLDSYLEVELKLSSEIITAKRTSNGSTRGLSSQRSGTLSHRSIVNCHLWVAPASLDSTTRRFSTYNLIFKITEDRNRYSLLG